MRVCMLDMNVPFAHINGKYILVFTIRVIVYKKLDHHFSSNVSIYGCSISGRIWQSLLEYYYYGLNIMFNGFDSLWS